MDDFEEYENNEKTEEINFKDIQNTASITADNGKYVIHCLVIAGQIEGHYLLPPHNKTTKYEHILPQLAAVEQDEKIDGLLVILNTVGGDVEAGLAIAEMISGMSKPTVSLAIGGVHSIGAPIACSSKCSFIAKSASMTLHPIRVNGLALGAPQMMSYFDKIQDRIINFVAERSKIRAERYKELMTNSGELVGDIGSDLDGERAVREGLIDKVGGISDALDCLYKMIDEKRSQKADEESDGRNQG
ncbi:MAG: ATP-dependent Clp protease proteolytic subunit [Oscillospiraceae bacterium]|nr:ATP-dependent Clp protease proteolytic subunit [Oscillospiraceae bacterium]